MEIRWSEAEEGHGKQAMDFAHFSMSRFPCDSSAPILNPLQPKSLDAPYLWQSEMIEKDGMQ